LSSRGRARCGVAAMNRRVFYSSRRALPILLALTMAAAAAERPRAGPGRSASVQSSRTDARVSLAMAQGSARAGGLRRRGDVPHVSFGPILQRDATREYVRGAYACRHARLRELPRSRPEACRKRDPSLIRNFKSTPPSEGERRLHDVPQPCVACAVGRQSARSAATSAVRPCHSVHAPKGPSQLKAKSVTDQCASCHRNVTTRRIGSTICRSERGATDLRVVPQRPWQHERQAAQGGHHG
jgi:hypothetical protein